MPTSKFQKKLYRFLFYLFWVVLAGIIWGELKPVPAGQVHTLWDSTLNFSAYFVLSALASWLLVPKRTALFATAGIIVVGLVLEGVQGCVGRDMSLCDGIANILGTLAGSGFVWGYCFWIAHCHNRAS